MKRTRSSASRPWKSPAPDAESLRRELFRYRRDLVVLLEQLNAADAALDSAQRSIETKDRYIDSLRSALDRAETEYRKLSAAVSAFIGNQPGGSGFADRGESASKVGDACLAEGAQVVRRNALWNPDGPFADVWPHLNSALLARGKRLAEWPRGSFAVCTIVARNYLSLARVWARSLRRHHPEAAVYVLLVDRLQGEIDISREPFELIEVSELEIPNFLDLAFKYNILELSTAVKPYFLEYLLLKRGIDRVLYFDPDTQVHGDLELALAALIDNNILLVPHILAPLPTDGKTPAEPDFLVSGTYNLGFIGVRSTHEVVRFLDWWKERLRDQGFSRPDLGQFTDQKWIDLVPALFSRVAVLRNSGYNVAYWNIPGRLDLTRTETGFTVGGQPLVFFHFSGIDFDQPDHVSKYQNRYLLADLNESYRELFYDYVQKVRSEDFDQSSRWPYAFGSFSDGTRIPGLARRLYFSQGESRKQWVDPFRADGSSSFLAWLLESPSREQPLPRILLELRRLRPDLGHAFPDVEKGDYGRFLEWAIISTPAEHDFGPRFIDEFKRLAAATPRSYWSPTSSTSSRFSLKHPSLRDLSRRASLDPAYHGPPASSAKRLLAGLLGKENYRVARAALWHFREVARQPVESDSERPRGALAQIAKGLLGADRYQRIRRATWEWRRLSSLPRRLEPREGTDQRVYWSSRDDLQFGANVFGYFDTETGIGEVARQAARTLHRAGINHVVRNIEQGWLRRSHSYEASSSGRNPYPINLFFVNADQLPTLLNGLESVVSDRINVGYWFWELARFPKTFEPSFRHLNEVWVASTFCQRAISDDAAIPVRRVGPGFEFQPPGISAREDFRISEDDYVVLYAFDAASVVARKNPAAVVSAFRKAFPVTGRELLVLKIAHGRPSTLAALKRMAADSRVLIIDENLSRGELLDLISVCDCYLSLHRSEGFGLTILAAMAMGKPVIATDYSGSRDLIDATTGLPVGYQLSKIRRASGPYPKGYVWAEPDVAHAARLLAEVRQNSDEAARRGAAALEAFQSEWSLSAGAARFRSELRRLWLQALEGSAPSADQTN